MNLFIMRKSKILCNQVCTRDLVPKFETGLNIIKVHLYPIFSQDWFTKKLNNSFQNFRMQQNDQKGS